MKSKVYKFNRRTRARAFTLLEVLMIIVILGLLAALVVPQLTGIVGGAHEDLARTQIEGAVTNALEYYKAAIGHYPTADEGGLQALVQAPDDEDVAKKWRGPYLKAKDLKDPWGNDLIYECPGRFNEDGFDLSSPGKDTIPGNDDDIKNWKES